MSNANSWQCLHSWWKQEDRALPPPQRRGLIRIGAVLLLAVAGVDLVRHHNRERQDANTQISQARELASAQWSTLRATVYDWAHWDETHAYARGEAPGYTARNLEAANGLSSVAPVVIIFNRSNALLTLQGRQGPSSWNRDPLVHCTRRHTPALLRQPRTHGLSCSDQAGRRLWLGVIEPITDSTEKDELSGLMVLLAPLRHPSHGPELQALMANLETQLQLAPPGPHTMPLAGQPIWGDAQRVLTLRPRSVALPALQSLGRDLALTSPFVLLFLAQRAALMLQQRRQDLRQRQGQRRSHRRLQRARRQLDQLFDQLPLQHRERALSAMAPNSGDPIDDLARRLEAYSAALQQNRGLQPAQLLLLYAPMRDRQGHLRRLLLQGPPLDADDLAAALAGWAALPAAWRQNLGLQIEPTPAQWRDVQFSSALQAGFSQHGCPLELCTLAVRAEAVHHAGAELMEGITRWRSAGFRLALIYTNGDASDPGLLLQRLPYSELQLSIPGAIQPHLEASQQALFTALVHLGQARGLQISAINLQTRQQCEALQALPIDLFAGPRIGPVCADPADLLVDGAAVVRSRLESL